MNKQIEVKIKKLDKFAVIPAYAKPGDAGLDLVATSVYYDTECEYWEYRTSIAIEIPEGYVGLIFPRSSIRDKEVYQTNAVGVIDSGYRGEIKVCFKDRTMFRKCAPYHLGDKIAQLIIIPYPTVMFTEVDTLSKTERGEGGHGSTGK